MKPEYWSKWRKNAHKKERQWFIPYYVVFEHSFKERRLCVEIYLKMDSCRPLSRWLNVKARAIKEKKWSPEYNDFSLLVFSALCLFIEMALFIITSTSSWLETFKGGEVLLTSFKEVPLSNEPFSWVVSSFSSESTMVSGKSSKMWDSVAVLPGNKIEKVSFQKGRVKSINYGKPTIKRIRFSRFIHLIIEISHEFLTYFVIASLTFIDDGATTNNRRALSDRFRCLFVLLINSWKKIVIFVLNATQFVVYHSIF